jgi:hypothetical protein
MSEVKSDKDLQQMMTEHVAAGNEWLKKPDWI